MKTFKISSNQTPLGAQWIYLIVLATAVRQDVIWLVFLDYLVAIGIEKQTQIRIQMNNDYGCNDDLYRNWDWCKTLEIWFVFVLFMFNIVYYDWITLLQGVMQYVYQKVKLWI